MPHNTPKLNVPQGGYINRYYDASHDITEKDIVQRRYNKFKAEANDRQNNQIGDKDVKQIVFAFLSSFTIAVAIMALFCTLAYLILK